MLHVSKVMATFHHPHTTNNRAEIAAVLTALCIAPRDQPLTIYSDSEYTIKVAQGTYQMKANPDLWDLYRILLEKAYNSSHLCVGSWARRS